MRVRTPLGAQSPNAVDGAVVPARRWPVRAVLPRRVARLAILALSLCLLVPGALSRALANESPELRTSQAAIGRLVGDHPLVDSGGRRRTFAEFRGKPLVLSLVYTSCYSICSGLTVNLREVLKVARQALGPGSFTALTLGFDTANDTPARMRHFAHERGAAIDDWIFASTDAAAMAMLMREVGFTYRSSAKGFDHIIQTTVIDAEGRVVLQIYGQDFGAPTLVDPLKRLLRGQALERGSISDLVRSVKLLCTIYDPTSGKYRFDYTIIVEIIAGVLALGMVGIALILSWRNVQ